MTTFAALQSRVNAAVAAKVATDEATLDGVAVTGKFHDAYAEQFSVAGSAPMFTLSDVAAASARQDSTLVHGGISYTVSDIQPDGTGMVLLKLDSVS